MAKEKIKNSPTENEGGENQNENAGSINPAEEHAKAKTEAAPTVKRTKKVLVSGAEFWKFAPEEGTNGDFDGVEFIGKYLGEVKREKDGKDAETNPNEKAGSVMGFNFVQEGTDRVWIIGNSDAIKKGLEKTGYNPDLLYCIEFLGKGKTANGKPYNRFEVSVLE